MEQNANARVVLAVGKEEDLAAPVCDFESSCVDNFHHVLWECDEACVTKEDVNVWLDAVDLGWGNFSQEEITPKVKALFESSPEEDAVDTDTDREEDLRMKMVTLRASLEELITSLPWLILSSASFITSTYTSCIKLII